MNAKRHLLIDENYPIGHDVDRFFEDAHDHDYYEFLYIIRGKAINVVNNDIQMLDKGCLLAIRPSDVHFIKKIENVDVAFEFFNIPVPAEYMQRQYDKCILLRDMIENSEIPRCVYVSNTELGVLAGKAINLIDLVPSEERNYLYFCLVKELCSCMIECDHIKNQSCPQWFSALIRELNNVEAEKISYDMILEKACVSKSVLCKTFKKVLGMTPSSYINKKKMEKAYSMVISEENTFTEIADELGYGSYIHFSREFVKEFGTTPKGIRDRK